MASFSVTNNVYLRNLYSIDRSLSVKNNRTEAPTTRLIVADSSALNKATKTFSSFNFDDDSKTNKEKFQKTLKSFADAYNYTVSSTSSLKSGQSFNAASKIKNLTEKYSSELKSLGISVKNGYMTISSTAASNISPDQYKELFGKDSAYMKELSAYAKKLGNSIDVSL